MHEVLVNRLGGLSLPRKSVVRLTDRPDMTLDVYRGRKTTMQQQSPSSFHLCPQKMRYISQPPLPTPTPQKLRYFLSGGWVFSQTCLDVS